MSAPTISRAAAATFEALGAAAYAAGGMRAPALSAYVQAEIAGAQVGDPAAAEAMSAYTRGFDRAADAAAAGAEPAAQVDAFEADLSADSPTVHRAGCNHVTRKARNAHTPITATTLDGALLEARYQGLAPGPAADLGFAIAAACVRRPR